MKRNIFILLIVVSILIVFSTLIFSSETIDVKDYIKGKFPVIFNIYLAPLGELDEYEKEFIDLLQNLPEEEQKNFAKEVYNNGFTLEILEKVKKWEKSEIPTIEVEEKEADKFQGQVIDSLTKRYQIAYQLTLEKDDYPYVEVKIINISTKKSEFTFGLIGGSLGAVGELKEVFKNIKIRTEDGKQLNWRWEDGNKIIVDNGYHFNFVISYFVDALKIGRSSGFSGMGEPNIKFVVFRAKRIFFVAGDIFLLPKADPSPSRIIVDFSFPEGTEIFSSLPKEGDKFIAKTDLWGNMVYDFQKAYFTGGEVIFSLTHNTEWGDKYIYIWFDRDLTQEAWLPSYGNTPWEEAKEYMQMTERFAKYYREIIGPLPQHIVLFTNGIHIPKFPDVKTHTDWFHYMQIWPRYSEPAVCHHVFLQYSFFISQSKLPFCDRSAISQFLSGGLPTYFEQTIPTILLGDESYKGKLFEFFILDERGRKFGIEKNQYHINYNISAMKVFLLDQYIQKITDHKKSINDFIKELWDEVKYNKEPKEIEEIKIIEAFKKVVGKSNGGYISKLAKTNNFDKDDFIGLLPCFGNYINWMAKKYFWGNKLLLFSFLEITSTKGEEWPHYATYPHNILGYRRDALVDFKDYLENVNKERFTQKDIIEAISNVTGKNHKGFFEFWKSYGFGLDPNSILPLDSWDLEERTEEEFVCSPWFSVGNLKTEAYISGHTQKAEVILDNPDDDGEIVIEVRLQSFSAHPPENEARNALSGENVSLLHTSKDKYKNIFITRAFFKMSTDDINRKRFNFSITLPSFSSHPKFLVYDYPLSREKQYGELYWLHSFDSK